MATAGCRKLHQNRGDENPAQKAGTVATNILNVVYNGNFPDGATSTNGTPCIMRVNKYTMRQKLSTSKKKAPHSSTGTDTEWP